MASNSAQTKGPRALSFMEKLSSEVSVYRPSTTQGSPSSPKIIVVASWTDARDEHIAKYIVKYQALYPTAQLVLIKSTTSLLFSPQQILQAAQCVVPIIKAALATESSPSSSSNLLIHIFSNGGSSSVANLYDAYAASVSEGEQGKVLPPHVTIFDSSPSITTFEGSINFFSVGLTSLKKIITLPVIYLGSFLLWSAIATGLIPDALSVWGKAHNDNTKNQVELRRTYIYSEADALVSYKNVESHASEAKANGFNVRMEKFEGSAHVSHARKDEDKYWGIVKSTWEGN